MSTQPELVTSIVGSADFCRRVQAILQQIEPQSPTRSANLAEGWSTIVTERPDCLIVEIGPHHNPRSQAVVRRLLSHVRERLGESVFIVIALMSSERLYFGGDLLFQEDGTLKASGLVDSFIASPPGNIPSIPDLSAQLKNLFELLHLEQQRRSSGHTRLPSLGMPGWAQSMADPHSRELWMRWLPRYASYTNENPIIIGHTGTGKTNLAFALHQLSGRSGQFISITPRDFSSSELVQAELFGAVAGAYTGAVDKWGLVKRAEKGTLFIDELQSIDKELQGKLITFIENKVYRRVGSAETVEADVRFVFASNRPLHDMMASNVLRDDFAYRLERVQLQLADLSDRRLDIPAALAHSLAKVYRQRPHAHLIEGLSSEAYRLLFGHRWPGNLRQLENNVAQLCERADMQQSRLIEARVVRQVFESRLSGQSFSAPEILAEASMACAASILHNSVHTLDDALVTFARSARNTALEARGGDFKEAAQLLGDSAEVLTLMAAGKSGLDTEEPKS